MIKAQTLLLGSMILASAVALSACTTSSPATQPAASEVPAATDQPAEAGKTYTLTDVAAHSTQADCWMVIDGGVYDVTNYAPKHPGGDDIFEGCGKDATSLFNARPGEHNTPHSPMAAKMLETLKIGDLAQ